MASTPTNAVNLTQDQLVKFLLQKIEYNIEIATIWPFMGVQGGKLRIERTNQFGGGDLTKIATILDDGGDISTAADYQNNADESKTYTVGELAFRYKLDYTVQDRYKFQSIDAVEAQAACQRLMLQHFYKLDVVNAGAVAGDYDSLYDIAGDSPSGGQIVTMGGALTFAKLQEAFYLCHAGVVGPNCIMCNSRTLRAILAAYQTDKIIPETVEADFPDPLTGGMCRRKGIAINGVRVYVNDMIPTTANASRIYFLVLGFCQQKGLYGVTSIVPTELATSLFVRRESAEPSAATTTRMNVTYTFPVAIACGTYSAISVLDAITV